MLLILKGKTKSLQLKGLSTRENLDMCVERGVVVGRCVVVGGERLLHACACCCWMCAVVVIGCGYHGGGGGLSRRDTRTTKPLRV